MLVSSVLVQELAIHPRGFAIESGKMRCRLMPDIAEPAYLSAFSSVVCSLLLGLALSVVSRWCQTLQR